MFCIKLYPVLILIIGGSSLNLSKNSEHVLMDLNAEIRMDRQIYNQILKYNSTLFEQGKNNYSTQLITNRRRRQTMRRSCSGLCKNSMCPWKDDWDFDSNRTPAFIAKATCNRKCVFDFSASSEILNIFTSCEPLKIDIPIFKDNTHSVLKDWPVACICTKKIVSSVPLTHIKENHVKGLEKTDRHYHMVKHRGRKRIRRKKKRKQNKSWHYRYFKIIPPVLKPFQFLPQYKKR